MNYNIYMKEEIIIENVKATMAMSGLELTPEEIESLKTYIKSNQKEREQIIQNIADKYKESPENRAD